MSNMRLWISAAIIAVVVLVIFSFSIPRTRDVDTELLMPADTMIVPEVTLRNSFNRGLHTITGSIEVSNACTTASAFATLTNDENGIETILIQITTKSEPGVCLQLPTQTSFETTISASPNLPIIVTVDGSAANVILI